MRNEEVLIGSRNILHTIKIGKFKWIGRILRKKCPLFNVIEGKVEGRIEVTGRRERRHKQLLDELQKNTGYLKLKRKH